jgi:hypothetical protein
LNETVVMGAVAEYEVAFDDADDAVRVGTDGLSAALEAGRARGRHLRSVSPVRSSLEARVLAAIAGA